MVGVVHSVASGIDGVTLEVLTANGPTSLHITRHASAEDAARVSQALHRCLSVNLVLDSDHSWHSSVRGIGYRNSIELPASITTALGLHNQGLPGVVRVP
jgi:hypothetical protein